MISVSTVFWIGDSRPDALQSVFIPVDLAFDLKRLELCVKKLENLHIVLGKGLTMQFFRCETFLSFLASVAQLETELLPTKELFLCQDFVLKENI